jgi:ribosomal protein L13
MFTKLKVYRGDKHPHEAQKPEVRAFAVGQGFKA